ncbi:hypothetical protein PAECIP112173_02175 [Paenibacillus sp. JJ-100]|nr:hypothetical protein PAECIP112173_02175 [Paenibacillus sp. JJ-100]
MQMSLKSFGKSALDFLHGPTTRKAQSRDTARQLFMIGLYLRIQMSKSELY